MKKLIVGGLLAIALTLFPASTYYHVGVISPVLQIKTHKEKRGKSTMKACAEAIIKDEGEVKKNGLHVMYKCPSGYNTLGHGHNCDASPLEGDVADYYKQHDGITDEMAFTLLMEDIYEVHLYLDKKFEWFVCLDEVRQDVLTNMCFNLGNAGFSKFKRMLAAVEAGDYERAAFEMESSLWYDQVGNRAKRLVKEMKTGERS